MRRIFGHLHIDKGPRRSPSACSEMLEKKRYVHCLESPLVLTEPWNAPYYGILETISRRPALSNFLELAELVARLELEQQEMPINSYG